MRKVGIYYSYWTTGWDVNFLPFVSKVKNLGFDQLVINGGTLVNMSAKNGSDLKMKELVKVAENNNVILNVEVIDRFEQFLLNTHNEAVNIV